MLATSISAQDQISIKISPALSYARAYKDPNTNNFGSEGVALMGKLGVVYDWPIKGNYYLSTGAFFVAKQIGIKDTTNNIKEQHNIQYLQVPVLLKLYTSEVALDTRLYVEVGITGAVRINARVTKLLGANQPMIKLRMWEIGALLSCGVEYNLSLFTSIFAGISYQPSLSSIVLDQVGSSSLPKIYAYADLVTLDIGIRF